MILNLLKNNTTACKIISIILGLGLASLFRKTCKSSNCIVIKGPSINEISKQIYKIDDKCYEYIPKVTLCDKNTNSDNDN